MRGFFESKLMYLLIAGVTFLVIPLVFPIIAYIPIFVVVYLLGFLLWRFLLDLFTGEEK